MPSVFHLKNHKKTKKLNKKKWKPKKLSEWVSAYYSKQKKKSREMFNLNPETPLLSAEKKIKYLA